MLLAAKASESGQTRYKHRSDRKFLPLVTSVWEKLRIKHKYLKQEKQIEGRFSDGMVKFIWNLLAVDMRKRFKSEYKLVSCGRFVSLLKRVWKKFRAKWKDRKAKSFAINLREASNVVATQVMLSGPDQYQNLFSATTSGWVNQNGYVTKKRVKYEIGERISQGTAVV